MQDCTDRIEAKERKNQAMKKARENAFQAEALRLLHLALLQAACAAVERPVLLDQVTVGAAAHRRIYGPSHLQRDAEGQHVGLVSFTLLAHARIQQVEEEEERRLMKKRKMKRKKKRNGWFRP